MYVRSNVPRIQADHQRLNVVDTAPIIHNLGPVAPVGPAYLDLVENALLYHFSVSDDWTPDQSSAMLCWLSRVSRHTINFFNGPYRFAGFVKALRFDPVRSPARFLVPDALDAESRIHFRTRVTRSDGRLSDAQRLHANPATLSPPVCIDLQYSQPLPDRWLVTFDQALQPEEMEHEQWRLIWDAKTWTVTDATLDGAVVTLTAGGPDPDPRPNRVRYLTVNPPFADRFSLHGADTGLAVPAFDYSP
jgi:hypothetical protein